jgi:hypothetical protein
LISKERIDSKFDKILEQMIVLCWHQIAKYGGAAAQEKTKKKECWDYVKSNLEIPLVIKEELKLYTISNSEKEKRDSVNLNDEDKTYFDSLHILLDNNAQIIQLMSIISNNQSNFIREKVLLQNHLKKITSKEQILAKKKIEEIINFYNKLIAEGFSLKDEINHDVLKINFSIKNIFESVFKNKNEFMTKFEKFVFDNEVEFKKNESLYNETSEIIEKFDREYGLSINDFEKLHEVIHLF